MLKARLTPTVPAPEVTTAAWQAAPTYPSLHAHVPVASTVPAPEQVTASEYWQAAPAYPSLHSHVYSDAAAVPPPMLLQPSCSMKATMSVNGAATPSHWAAPAGTLNWRLAMAPHAAVPQTPVGHVCRCVRACRRVGGFEYQEPSPPTVREAADGSTEMSAPTLAPRFLLPTPSVLRTSTLNRTIRARTTISIPPLQTHAKPPASNAGAAVHHAVGNGRIPPHIAKLNHETPRQLTGCPTQPPSI